MPDVYINMIPYRLLHPYAGKKRRPIQRNVYKSKILPLYECVTLVSRWL